MNDLDHLSNSTQNTVCIEAFLLVCLNMSLKKSSFFDTTQLYGYDMIVCWVPNFYQT